MAQSWMELKIESRMAVATDIVAFSLVAPDGSPLPHFSAGSHIDVEIRPGLIRQYSLCNTPRDHDRYEIAILRDPASRGGSTAIHDDFAPGQLVRTSEPRNLFPLIPSEAAALLFAGGIGITPLLCMAERLSHLDAPFDLHYCSRSLDRTAFVDRLDAANFSDRVHYHFDDGAAEQKLDAVAALKAADRDSHVYICGPAGFIDWILDAAKQADFPADHVHREYFNAEPSSSEDDGAFEVQIASTGQVFAIPADQSVAQVLNDNGIQIDVSCEQGICGTCITRLIEGSPDHRDMLSLGGDDEFTPCCSRSLTPRLVLDL
jgi:vanillate O-demethylase ferredoxin subunit